MNEINPTMQVETICPHCQKENKTTINTVISNIDNPRLSKKLIEDTFFQRKCKYCGEEYFIDHTVAYKDDKVEKVICYAADNEGEAAFVDTMMENMKLVEQGFELCPVRIVKERNQLREKARIFEMGLDDKIIEVIKIWGLEYLREHDVNDMVHTILCWVLDDLSLEICFFTESESYMMMLPYEHYEETEDALMEMLEDEEEELYYVDIDWAMDFTIRNGL